ncbi:hypothetical protein ABEB36_013108 [Hypothenemus hampei]|uniref:SUN domain-containing protein n=1 Tax=Hypothenemus hampei TaxID=57062 RepID=A0ABD1E6U8_HYPHA
MYGEPNLADLLPGLYCNNILTRQSYPSVWKTIFTHLLTILITGSLCFSGYYYYQNVYIPMYVNKSAMDVSSSSLGDSDPDFILFQTSDPSLNDDQFERINEAIIAINNWRTQVNAEITKIQWEQDIKINNAIQEYFEIFEADNIGLMDYAAYYAGAVITRISKDTLPHPTYRPLSLFKIINIDLLSNPEEIIRPCVLPGSCFAFRGNTGSVRIKLGKPINIGAVTMSHASALLLGPEGMNSAPKDFEVYGFINLADEFGTFLGKFIYNRRGKQHQTFEVPSQLSGNQIFEEVELTILSNHGKKDFTCIYRFRVHKNEVKGSNHTRVSKKCC